MPSKGSSTWAIICYLRRCISDRLGQKQQPGLRAHATVGDADVPSSSLTHHNAHQQTWILEARLEGEGGSQAKNSPDAPFPGRPEEEYRHQLGRYGISGELAMRPVASLSGGQKSRVAFAQMTMPW